MKPRKGEIVWFDRSSSPFIYAEDPPSYREPVRVVGFARGMPQHVEIEHIDGRHGWASLEYIVRDEEAANAFVLLKITEEDEE